MEYDRVMPESVELISALRGEERPVRVRRVSVTELSLDEILRTQDFSPILRFRRPRHNNEPEHRAEFQDQG